MDLSPHGAPPRPWRWLLYRALPLDVRDGIVGDMEETYRRRRSRYGALRSYLWYAGQVVMLGVRFLPARIGSWSVGRPGISWLDLKLGLRMLVKHPGLTVVGTLALSAAMATVAGVHSFAGLFLSPELPVPEGDRVVGIWNVDLAEGGRAGQTLGDMLVWREELESVEDVGAFTTYERVLTVPGGETRSIRVAQISNTALGMLRVPPHLGRLLTQDEGEPNAPAVALIGFDLWRSAFLADSSIIGRTVRIGEMPRTVVGVMPEGFRFPINEEAWIPAAVPSSALQPGEGSPIAFTIGRLAPGATLGEAALEVELIGARLASARPDTHALLQPRIEPYTQSFLNANDPGTSDVLRLLRVLVLVVLVIASVNVGVLVYARTAARASEISIRKALGASRPRIALQLFAEALVLSSLAGALGYAIAGQLVRFVTERMSTSIEAFPYWWDGHMSSSTLLLVVILVASSAALTGVLPALSLTSGGVRSTLQRIGAGDSGLSFGRAASAVVVGQVAVSVAALILMGGYVRPFLEDYAMDDGIARGEYLTAEIRLDQGLSADGSAMGQDFARKAEIWRELGRRVELEPKVLDVTFGTSFPGMEHPVFPFRAQGVPLPYDVPTADRARVAWVEPGYFDAFDVLHLQGRTFDDSDTRASSAQTAVVTEGFVRQIFQGTGAVGRLVRLGRTDEAAWAEIVGVVPDLTVDMGSEAGVWPTIYFPLVDTPQPVHIAVRMEEDPAQFTSRLRSLGQAVDPLLVLHRPSTLQEIARNVVMVMYLFGAGVGLLVLAALVLSTAGTYSLMSFVVAQRRREIGIRCALGARHRRVVREVFARALIQVALGTGLGLAVGWLGTGSRLWQQGPGPIIGVVVTLLIMALFACGHPTLRALRIEPTEALQEG